MTPGSAVKRFSQPLNPSEQGVPCMILRVLRRTFQTTWNEAGEFYSALILQLNIDCQPARCKTGKAPNTNDFLVRRHSIYRILGLLYSEYRELRFSVWPWFQAKVSTHLLFLQNLNARMWRDNKHFTVISYGKSDHKCWNTGKGSQPQTV
jgi:hypothetical protein